MASTAYTDTVTLIVAAWLNDMNDGIYKGVGTTGYSTVASATTPDIFATTVSGVINYTGTTTCTGFVAAPSAGARRVLICAGAAVFTAGANMLIDGVTSGNSLTCAANDTVYVYAVTTTQFRLSRIPYAGFSGGLVKIGATQTASSSASIDFTSASYASGFDGTYNEVVFVLTDIIPATNGDDLWVRISNAATFKTASYASAGTSLSDAGAGTSVSGSALAQAKIAPSVSSAASEGLSGEVRGFGYVNTAKHKKHLFSTAYDDTANFVNFTTGSFQYYGATTAIDGVRFMFNSGTISSGSITMLGVQK